MEGCASYMHAYIQCTARFQRFVDSCVYVWYLQCVCMASDVYVRYHVWSLMCVCMVSDVCMYGI